MKLVLKARVLKGSVTIPTSKSDTQRALLCAALASGRSTLHGVGESDDEQAMVQSIQKLGAQVTVIAPGSVEIEGIQKLEAHCSLHAGESGLGLRLLTAVCASFDQQVTLHGSGSLLKRPMHFYDEVLPLFGARCVSQDGLLPLQVQGPLVGAKAEVDGSLSSQFISGLLMGLPRAAGASELFVPVLHSGPYVQMTMQTLEAFGIRIEKEGNTFYIPGNQAYQPCVYHIEADWSSASYWLLAAALGHPIQVRGLSMRSKQADKQFLQFLIQAGCKVRVTDTHLSVDGSELRPFSGDATHCPDLFPALVVLAAKAKGVSRITGANRLIHKESNRAKSLQQEFGKMGLRIDLVGDEMQIHGTGELIGADVSTHGDHRIAMSLAIASTFAQGETLINDSEVVSKSYPKFWVHYNDLTN